MDEPTKETKERSARERGYEDATSRIGIPAVSALGLLALVVGAVLLMAGMFYALVAYQDAQDPGPSPMIGSRMPPAGPKLLPDTPDQVRELRTIEDSLLTTYGWVDRENGFARIPLDRAMSLVAGRGLPAFQPTGAQP